MVLLDWIRSNPRKTLAVALVGALLGYVVFQIVASLAAFNAIASEDFSPDKAAEAIQDQATITTPPDPESHEPTVPTWTYERLEAEQMMESRDLRGGRELHIATAVSPELPDEMFTSVLLIGTDASGALADVIIYVLLPSDGSAPMMVSIPRDLYLLDHCSGGYARVNATLGGCRGVASGAELAALTVGSFTGIEVDHFARVNFDGFIRVIDRLGGATVCVGDHPVRDLKSDLHLDAGCHHADGYTTLAWVRSRNPEYLIDGEWQTRGGSDFDRQRKQQDLLFQLADKLSSYSTVASLASALESLASAVRMDSGWSILEVAQLGIQYRGIGQEDVVRLQVPVEDYRTGSGAQVLLPGRSFNEVLAQVYSPARR